jgi:hypothetical protein
MRYMVSIGRSFVPAMATFLTLVSSASVAGPKEETERQAQRDRAALSQFPEVNRAAKDVAPIIDRAARNHAESSVQRSAGTSGTITSRDRPRDSPISSRAHDRGAIDVVTPNMGRDAARISKEAGPGYTAIHEKPVRTQGGKSYDSHELYQGGTQVGASKAPPRATGEHIHLQPEFNKRLHEATSPPARPATEAGTNSSGKGTR